MVAVTTSVGLLLAFDEQAVAFAVGAADTAVVATDHGGRSGRAEYHVALLALSERR